MPYLIVVFSLLFSVAQANQAAQLKSGVFDPPYPAPEFVLPGSNGSEFKLSAQRGKLIVLGFGFSHCPNVCPVTLATLAQVQKRLGELSASVQVVYITVDPERDDAARLKEYLGLFDSHFIGLTGAANALQSVREAYGVMATKAAMPNEQSGYTVHHSSSLYLIDRSGRLRALVPYGKSADDIVHDIKLLLQR